MGQSGELAFGDDLRKAREKQGLAVENISESTKVPAKHIRALEAGHLAEIPGGVFRRGFVRSYIGALGLEEVRWMRRFDEVCRERGLAGGTDSDWTKFAENVKNSRASTPRSRAVKSTGFALALIALAVAGWCCWRWVTHRRLLPAPLAGIYSNSWVESSITPTRAPAAPALSSTPSDRSLQPASPHSPGTR